MEWKTSKCVQKLELLPMLNHITNLKLRTRN